LFKTQAETATDFQISIKKDDSSLSPFGKVYSCLGSSKRFPSPLVKVNLEVKNAPRKLKAYTTSKRNQWG